MTEDVLKGLNGWHRWGAWAAHFFVDGKQLCDTHHGNYMGGNFTPARPKATELAPTGLPYGRVCARCLKLQKEDQVNVLELSITNFALHDRTKIVLPARGLVVVTGENGAGKSSIIEGIAWAGWGKTLRGTPPWRGDAKTEPCTAQLVTDELMITRTRKGSKSELEWEAYGAYEAPGSSSDDPEFETPTKAQEALAQLLGPFDLWRRSHVFSSADAAHFTLATDADRKRLIETFLGNDRFDGALETCRSDLKNARTRLDDLTRKRDLAQVQLQAAQTRLTETKRAIASVKDPEGVVPSKGKPLAHFEAQICEAEAELTKARATLRDADRAGAGWESHARSIQAQLDRIAGDKCPTCSQAIPKKLREALALDVRAAKGKAEIEKKQAGVNREEVEALFDELNEELTALRAKHAERRQALRLEEQAKAEVERSAKLREALQRTLRETDDSIATLTDALQEMEPQVEAASDEVLLLEACERVLGLKGVRAHILGRSLAGIEAVANAWLARLRPGLKLTLKPYSELKKGGTDDSISLEVQGAGGGFGYKASSGGERRRLDVAMLLALAEVAAASRGCAAGTLFFDEVFDCLDEAGTEAVVGALRELAVDRAVVVITHSKVLLEKVQGSRRLHVARGRLVELG